MKARELLPDGSYRRVDAEPGQPEVRSQERFLEMALQAANRRSTDAVMPPIPFVEPRPRGTRRQRQQKMG